MILQVGFSLSLALLDARDVLNLGVGFCLGGPRGRVLLGGGKEVSLFIQGRGVAFPVVSTLGGGSPSLPCAAAPRHPHRLRQPLRGGAVLQQRAGRRRGVPGAPGAVRAGGPGCEPCRTPLCVGQA